MLQRGRPEKSVLEKIGDLLQVEARTISMKRDIELYRKILLAMEACPSSRCDSVDDLPDVLHEQFGSHIYLLQDAGLITAIDMSIGREIDWQPRSITHEGHEFLDHLRSDTMWALAKDMAQSAAGGLSLEVLKVATKLLVTHALARILFPEMLVAILRLSLA